MPTPRSALCSAVVNGRIYVIGGANGGGANGAVSATVEAYDPVADQWTRLQPMPTARFGLSCSALNGAIYAVAGAPKLPPPHEGIPTVERFDPGGD